MAPTISIRLTAVLISNLRPRQVQLNRQVFHILSRPQPKAGTPHLRAFSIAARRYAVVQEDRAEEDDAREVSEEPRGQAIEVEAEGSDDGSTLTAEKSEQMFTFEEQQLEFKRAMRTVPHAVAIITAQSSTAEDNVKAVMGATVSSFNTVSFDPDLVVTFNLRQNSSTYQAILDSKHFCVSFPINDPSGSRLSDSFTSGNDPPPLHPGRTPKVTAIYWNSLRKSTPAHIKQYPPAVRLDEKSTDSGDGSGFAFAFLCEHQNSVPVGDHVIVVGRLIPHRIQSSKQYGWGHSADYGGAWSSSHITMPYVHGSYASTDNISGFDDIWRQDDQYHNSNPAELTALQLEHAENNYKKRLEKIQYARNIQDAQKMQDAQKVQPEISFSKRRTKTAIHAAFRASELSAKQLDRWERHYTERLAMIKEIRHGSDAEKRLEKTKEPEVETELEKTQESEFENEHKTAELSAWQDRTIRKKMHLSVEELQKEEALYVGRLQRLHADKTKSQPESSRTVFKSVKIDDGTATQEDVVTVQEDEAIRIVELNTYLTERIAIIQEALRRKQLAGTPAGDKKKSMLNPYRLGRFMRTNSLLGYDDLKRVYRRNLTRVMEARISLLETQNRPDEYDGDVIINLNRRIDFYSETADLIAGILVERLSKANPRELKDMISRQIIDNPGPPPRDQAPKSKKQKGTHFAANRDTGFLNQREKDVEQGEKVQLDDTSPTTPATGKAYLGALRRPEHVRRRTQNMDSSTVGNDSEADMPVQASEDMHAMPVTTGGMSAEDKPAGNVSTADDDDALVMKHYEDEEIPSWPRSRKQQGGTK